MISVGVYCDGFITVSSIFSRSMWERRLGFSSWLSISSKSVEMACQRCIAQPGGNIHRESKIERTIKAYEVPLYLVLMKMNGNRIVIVVSHARGLDSMHHRR